MGESYSFDTGPSNATGRLSCKEATMIRKSSVAGALAGLLMASGIAAAADHKQSVGEKSEMTAVGTAKTSITEAITNAEQATGGKAFAAELENQDGVTVYQVDLLKDGKKQSALVAFDTGKASTTLKAEGGYDEDNEQSDAGAGDAEDN